MVNYEDIFLYCVAIFMFYILIRAYMVIMFVGKIIEQDIETLLENYEKGTLKDDDKSSRLPSYARMLFSFKPLKEKYWL
jgi:hypothetical protein